MATPTRILFVRPDAYGDLVLFEPVLRLVGEAFPDARLAVMIHARYADIAPLVPGRAEWILARCDPYRQGFAAAPGLESLRRAVEEFRPDCLVAACFDKTWLEAVVASWVPGARTVSLGPYALDAVSRVALRRQTGIDVAAAYDEVVDVDPASQDWEKNLDLAAHLVGGPVPRVRPQLSVPPAIRRRADAWLARRGLAPGYLACFPAGVAKVAIKAWPASSFAAVIAHAQEAWGGRPLLLAHQRETGILDATAAALGEAGRDAPRWVGRKGQIATLAALLETSAAYLGNDTGAMHIAGALGRPVIAVFGGGHWPRFVPAAETSVSVVHPLACFGCGWDCLFGDAPCLTRIPVEAVTEALGQVLAGTASAGSRTVEVDTLSDGERTLVAAAARARGLRGGNAGSADPGARDQRSLALLITQLEDVERDRADRLALIERQGQQIGSLQAEVDRWLREAGRLGRELEESQAALGRAQAEVVLLKGHFEASEADRAARLGVIEQQGAHIASLEAEVARWLKEAQQLGQESEERAAALRDAHASLEEARAEARLLKGHLEASEADRAARLDVIEQQGAQIAALQAEVERWLKEARSLRTESEERQAALQHVQTSLTETEAAFRKAQADVAALRGHFEASEADRAARLEVIERQGAEIASLQAEVARWLGETQRLARESQERTAGLQDVQAALQDAQARAAALKGHFEASEADRAARLEVIERQGAEIASLQAEVARWLGEARSLRAESEERAAALRDAHASLEEARAEARVLKGHLEASEADRAARLVVIERQGSRIAALEAEVDRWLKEARRLAEQVATLQASVHKLVVLTQSQASRIVAAEEERDAARNAHDDIRAQFVKSEADREGRRLVIKQQGQEIVSLQAEVHRLLGQTESDALRLQAIERERDAVRSALQQVQAEASRLAQQLGDLESRHLVRALRRVGLLRARHAGPDEKASS